MFHDPGHSMEDFKVLWDYRKKHARQRPHKEYRASGREKIGKTVKFKSSTKDTNHIIQKAVYTVLSNKGIKINQDPENTASDKEC